MFKTCALAATAAATMMLALPQAAVASENDVTRAAPANAATSEFSSHRYRYRYRPWVYRPYRAYPYYAYRPYRAYRAYPYYGYRAYPYRYGYWGRPGFSFGFSF